LRAVRPEKALAKWPAARAPRHQQRAGRVLVEPMDELRPTALPRQAVEQPVEMLRRLGPALSRQARRLVEHEGVWVLVDHHLADELLLVLRERIGPLLRPC
jgi:hypothetical protein